MGRIVRKSLLPYRHINPPPEGLIKESSNKTRLTRNVGKISLSCDFCNMEYETYAAWAKRYSHHYCSMACKYAAQLIRVKTKCVVCGSVYFVTPSSVIGSKTCSPECEHINRSNVTVDRHKANEFPVRQGESASNVKLKSADVLLIKTELASQDCRKQKEIANDFGVSRELISRIKRNLIWRHI